jgi:hypothetical protein
MTGTSLVLDGRYAHDLRLGRSAKPVRRIRQARAKSPSGAFAPGRPAASRLMETLCDPTRGGHETARVCVESSKRLSVLVLLATTAGHPTAIQQEPRWLPTYSGDAPTLRQGSALAQAPVERHAVRRRDAVGRHAMALPAPPLAKPRLILTLGRETGLQ